MRLRCSGCKTVHQKIQGSQHPSADLVMALWFADKIGLNHYAAACLVCGELHDTTGSWGSFIGKPFKVINSFPASDLIVALLELGGGQSTREFLETTFRLPDQIINALMQSGHIPSDIPKQRPRSFTPYLSRLEGRSDWLSNGFAGAVVAILENNSWVLEGEISSPLQSALLEILDAPNPFNSAALKTTVEALGGIDNLWIRRKTVEALQTLDTRLTSMFEPGQDITAVTLKVAALGMEYLHATTYANRNNTNRDGAATSIPTLICFLFIRDVLFTGDVSSEIQMLRERLFAGFLRSLD